jgi:hypothetical protein
MDQHAVSVTVKPIALSDGVPIRGQNPFTAGERADEHEQRRAGQMEIRQERVNNAEVDSG